jgi:hypothetical protein
VATEEDAMELVDGRMARNGITQANATAGEAFAKNFGRAAPFGDAPVHDAAARRRRHPP